MRSTMKHFSKKRASPKGIRSLHFSSKVWGPYANSSLNLKCVNSVKKPPRQWA